jgi:hypothetical protein
MKRHVIIFAYKLLSCLLKMFYIYIMVRTLAKKRRTRRSVGCKRITIGRTRRGASKGGNRRVKRTRRHSRRSRRKSRGGERVPLRVRTLDDDDNKYMLELAESLLEDHDIDEHGYNILVELIKSNYKLLEPTIRVAQLQFNDDAARAEARKKKRENIFNDSAEKALQPALQALEAQVKVDDADYAEWRAFTEFNLRDTLVRLSKGVGV